MISNISSLSDYAISGFKNEPHPQDTGLSVDQTKLIAFYLPQYHRIAENNEWWGPGFTEWTNVARGRPNFDGHYQPHIPRDLGFYDLSRVEVMREQAQLAKQFGVHGFCFYYYWFSGRRILETPLDNFLNSDVDMPFCLCWANENWTRTWDGDTKSVLLEQKYDEDDEERLIESLMPFFLDPRYIRVDGKPKMVVYRVNALPNPSDSVAKWRAAAEKFGLPGLHLVVVDFYDIADPREVGADALVEFPPHKFNGPQNIPHPIPRITNSEFSGGIVDYVKMIAQSANREQPDFNLYRGIIPGWDNTARRQNSPTIIVNNSPELFGAWLGYLRAYTRKAQASAETSFIFINAWNEWGEGCHLEPDMKWGLSFLEETKRSQWYDTLESSLTQSKERLQFLLSEAIEQRHIPASADIESYRPQSSTVNRASAVLRRYPLIHRLARSLYHMTYKLFN